MRALCFNIFFMVMSFVYITLAMLLSFLPGRAAVMKIARCYTREMVWAMRNIAGINVTVAGHEHLNHQGPVIIASKHQSYGDGFVLFSQFKDLSFVTGNQIEKFPFVSRVLQKMNAVVIDSSGGDQVRETFKTTSQIIQQQGRRVLIFPEGHLSEPGTHHRYRKGIWYLYKDFDCPVVPVASNLGQRWNQIDWKKHRGDAVMEFMEPIPPGLEKEDFMALLQDRIETRSIELLDLDNPGALYPGNIGKRKENASAFAKRLKREAIMQREALMRCETA